MQNQYSAWKGIFLRIMCYIGWKRLIGRKEHKEMGKYNMQHTFTLLVWKIGRNLEKDTTTKYLLSERL